MSKASTRALTRILFFIAMVAAGSGQLAAQEIKKDFTMPQMNACGDAETVEVAVIAGSTLCNGGSFSFTIPDGFELEPGTIRLDNVPYSGTLTSANVTGGTKWTLPGLNINASATLNIKFDVRALCEGIVEEGDEPRAIDYEFTGCFDEILTADSEALNVNYAVLHISVSQDVESGVVGDVVERTITILNQGNGSIGGFTLRRAFNGLTPDNTGDLALSGNVNWSAGSGNDLVYTSPLTDGIANGASVTFTEHVEITGCADLTTTYEAYYGCTGVCAPGADTLEVEVAFDHTKKPRLVVTPTQIDDEIECLEGDDDVLIWIVKNEGTGVANNLDLSVTTSNTGITTSGSVEWSLDGSTSWSSDFSTLVINSGAEVYMRVTQQHTAPTSGDCATAPSSFAFGNAQLTGSYEHAHGCPTDAAINISSTIRNSITFSFDAVNMGALDVLPNAAGADYTADFVMSSVFVDHVGLTAGATATISFELENLTFGAGNIEIYNYKGEPYATVAPTTSTTYTKTFEYGTSDWPTNTSLNLSGLRVLFGAELTDCAAASTSYTLKTSMTRGSGCGPIDLRCIKTDLDNSCSDTGCANGGLINGLPSLKRVNIGLQEQTVNGLPASTTITATNPLMRSTAFTTNDILEISQQTTVSVTGTSPVTEWTTGNMAVTLPAGLTWAAEGTSGKIVIKRGSSTATVTGLPVNISGGVATMNFNVADFVVSGWPGDLAGFTGFIDGDELLMSLQVRPTSNGDDEELKEFPVASEFTYTNEGTTTSYSCGTTSSASGFYARGVLKFSGSGSGNIESCAGNASASVTLDYSLINSQRNALFPLEHRQVLFPKTAVFAMSAGMQMTGVRMVIEGQGEYGGTKERTLTFPAATGTYTYPLEAELIALQNQGYSRTYLDEGFQIRLYPIVQSTCDAGETGTVTAHVTYQGIVRDESHTTVANHVTPAATGQTATRTLSYNTGKGSLIAASSQANVLVSGTGASWIVQISNSSAFRTMEGVWLRKLSGDINIASVELVTGYSDTNSGTPVALAGSNYGLGTFAPGDTKYYRITAVEPLPNCTTGGLNLEYGQTCGTECKEGEVPVLSYTMGTPKLQARVIFETAPSARPEICAEFPYAIEINNAGSALAQDIVIVVPLVSNAHLEYVAGSLRATKVYSGPSAIGNFDDLSTWTWGSGSGAGSGATEIPDTEVQIIPSATSLTIIIPVGTNPSLLPDKLGAGEKINIGFKLAANGCDFRSGQRIRFAVSGKNICGGNIPSTSATSARVTIKNAPADSSPEIAKSAASAHAIATHNAPGPLYANYSVTFGNTTSNTHPLIGGLNPVGVDPVDPDASPDQRHRISIKLPQGWVFDENPEALFPADVAQYVNYDEAVRGYIFVLTAPVPSGESISLTNKQIRYAGANPAALDCTTLTIHESIFRLFDATGGVALGCTPDFVLCWGDHVVYEGTTPLLMEVEPPTVTGPQVFCVSSSPTVADLAATGDNLRFYNSSGVLQAPTAPLSTGTYYVSSSLVPNGVCESPRAQFEVYIPIADAGPNQEQYNQPSFTLAGNAPLHGVQGEWTIFSVTGTSTLADITITDPTSRNTTVTGLRPGTDVVLVWTMDDGNGCTSSDQVEVRSLIRPIVANDDDYTLNADYHINGKTGGSEEPLPSVVNTDTPTGSGDQLGGAPTTIGGGVNQVTLYPGTPNHPNLEMNSSTGEITVLPNTPAGDYQFPYTICEVVNPINCDNAVATIRVVAPAIVADNDDFTGTPISGNGGKTPSVLDFIDTGDTSDDRLNNQPINPAEVTISTVVDNSSFPPPSELTLNPDGTITVTPGTPSGDYTLRYKICEVLNPTSCAEANATVRVRTPIDAVNDGTYQVRASTTTTQLVGNALDNDTLNGSPAEEGSSTTSNSVTVTTVTGATPIGGSPVPVLAANGDISVPAGTPAGDYSITYRICENNLTGPENCDNAIITIKVTDKPIVATPNTYGPVKGNVGDNNLGNVLSDDLLDGQVATLGTNGVTLTPNTAGNTYHVGGLPTAMPTIYPSIDPTGNVVVPSGTPDGVYTLPYTICETANTNNCATSYARVTVGDATIDAKDNHFTTPISGSAGGTTTSVIVDDRLNGDPLTVGDIGLITDPTKKVTLTPGTAPSPAAGSITMNPDGTITVAPGTTAGTYSYPYEICQILNPTNCDHAVAVITVSPTPIVVDNDTFGPVNGATGSTVADIGNHVIFNNDSFNSASITAASVTDGTLIVSIVHSAIPVRTGASVPSLNTATGVVSVPAGTPEGQYQITYRICEALNPTNCDDAIVTINVEAAQIAAAADTYGPIIGNVGTGGTALPSVVLNDTFNGTTLTVNDFVSSGGIGSVSLKITPGARPHPGISMNSAGQISVAANTPAGVYQYPYTICEILNPTNCSTALATVNVVAPLISAEIDPLLTITNGANGGTTTSVLDNDLLGGNPLNPAHVRVVPGTVSGGPATVADPSQYLTMNPDGTISAKPGTPAGTYTYTYTICEVLNPTNCSPTPGTATITVAAATIQAVNDGTYTVNGASGNPYVANALTNDRLNGVQAIIGNVNITVTTPASGTVVPQLDPLTGIISVPAGTPVGTYTIEYEICEVLNPANCSTASITVVVPAPAIVANDNTYGPVKGSVGSSNLGNVLHNDTYNGSMATVSQVDITTNPSNDTFNGSSAGLPAVRPELNTATGIVSVPVGTPDGVYTITYTIVDELNPANTSTATVTITVGDATIDAEDNYFVTPINGAIGTDGTPLASVILNDRLDGDPLFVADIGTKITLTPGARPHANIIMDSNGRIEVLPGTPAGTYSYPYTICDVTNPSNCDSAVAILTITGSGISVNNDIFGPFNGATGQPNIDNIFTNDNIDGTGITASMVGSTIAVSIVHDAEPVRTGMPVPTLEPTTGQVTVPAGTPAGVYHITYKVCELLNINNCDDAIVTINVEAPPIVANVNNFGSTHINGADGTTSLLPSVVRDDTLNGASLTVSDIDNTITLTRGTRPHPNIRMNENGRIRVLPGTPAGVYQYPYTICEVLNPTNCASAHARIVVSAADFDLTDDTFGIANGSNGGTTASVLNNDELNDAAITHSEVRLIPGSASHPTYLTMNGDGSITVRPGTPAGSYTYPYTVCEVLNPSNCASAEATITVDPATIVAFADGTFDVNGASGDPAVVNVLGNDVLNGAQATLDKVRITVVTPATSVVDATNSNVPVLDPSTGMVRVPANTPAGTYTITYSITDLLNDPSNFSETDVTIYVGYPAIQANPNTYGPVKGNVGSSYLGNVLSNDSYNGHVPTLGDVTLDIVQEATSIGGGPVPLLDPATGVVSVLPNTPDGVYNIEYSICAVLNPTSCSNSVITVTVGDSSIDAVDDDNAGTPINGSAGGHTSSVLGNDFLTGSLLDPADITLTWGTPAGPAGVSFPAGTTVVDYITTNGDGTITVEPGAPAGTYTVPYTICEVLNPTNCDSAVALVVVTAAHIDAINDIYGSDTPIYGRYGANLPSVVLDNDLLNHTAITDAAQVTVTWNTSPLPGKIQGYANGEVTVDPLTPAGHYTYAYRICEVLNPENCDDAEVTIIVRPTPLTATMDPYGPINGKNGVGSLLGSTEESVLANDEILQGDGSMAVLDPADIILTPGTPPHPGILMLGGTSATKGRITVLPGTPAGLYWYPYEICEVLNPTNCTTSFALITVVAADLVAVDDPTLGSINGFTGGKTVASVLDNDQLNGSILNPAEVYLTPLVSSDHRIRLNDDGTITVAPGTPAGTYTHTYRICEILNPTNCKEATATVLVTEALITANLDNYTGGINGASGNPSVGNALTNDLLNALPVTLDKVFIKDILQATSAIAGPPASPVPALDEATGNISVPAGTPAGSYDIGYTICEVLNPTNCASTTITVAVTAAPIVANDNTFGPVRGHVGTLNLGSVLTNDTFNGNLVTLGTGVGNVSLTWNVLVDGTAAPITSTGTTFLPGKDETDYIMPQADGTIAVAEGTPDGVYTVTYRICDNINVSPLNTNCDIATVKITIGAATIDAQDDYYNGGINGMNGGNTFPFSVLRNDFLNGTLIVNTSDVILTWGTPHRVAGAHPVLSDASAFIKVGQPGAAGLGFITVEPGTPAGDYAVPYTICETLNPTTNCDDAVAIIRVTAAPIDAVNNTYGPVNGHVGSANVGNVLSNDRLNGVLNPVIGTGGVTISEVHGATPLRPGANVPSLNTANGVVSVPARTPEGEYQITYRICEVLNPFNCDDAMVTVVVHEAPIVANDDIYVALPNGMVGSTMTAQQFLAPVLSNDRLNGQVLTVADINNLITFTPGTRPHPNIIIDPLFGSDFLVVLPNTPAGVYAYPYTICEVLNPANCDDAVIYITVPATGINAVNDDFRPAPINGMVGGKTASVLDNDEFVHVPLPFGLSIKDAVADNRVKLVPGASSASQYLTMNADGTITVRPGTPEGDYWYDYQICEVLNLNMLTGPNCDEARATIRVVYATIHAEVDNFGPVNGASGTLEAGNAFTNDTLNGFPFTADLVRAVQTGPITSLNGDNLLAVGKVPVFDPATGIVSVPAGTPADTYTIPYRIYERLNDPDNYSDATINIVVTAAPIQAVADIYGPVRGHIGTLNLGNVLGNDSFNDQAAVLGTGISHVTITNVVDALPLPTSTVPEVPYMEQVEVTTGVYRYTGRVMVPEATPDGVYTIEYTICDNINVSPMPTHCSTTEVTITVGNATIDAIDDSNASEKIIGRVGGTMRSVLDNDLLNGTLVNKDIDGIIVDPLTNVILTWNVNLTGGSAPTTGPAAGVGNIVPQPDGTILVLPNTPEGTYLVPYRICERINTSNCDIAIAKVVVVKADIDAIPDLYRDVDGKLGQTLPTVLNNDLLDFAPIMPTYWADVTLTPGASPLPGKITMRPNSAGANKGVIDVAPETPAGHYFYSYRICEVLNPLNCDDATVEIMVVVPKLEAFDDNYCATPINGYTGGVLPVSVLSNDRLNGIAVLRSEVFFEPSTSPHANISMDSNGVITIGAKTPAGTYRFTYQICEVVNPTNCDIGEASICVVWPEIKANDDNFGPMNSTAGGTTPTVLHNDLLNGSLVKPSEVKIIPWVSSSPDNIIMNPDGTILVRPGTPEGTYTHTYQICEVLNPENCDDAMATIIVSAATLSAAPDDFCANRINGKTGGTTLTSVLVNDRLNGVIVNPSDIVLTPLVASHTGLSMNSNGTITVAPETPVGMYTYTYRICEVINPTNCTVGTATICVRAAEIDAIYDNFLAIPIIGKAGGTTSLSVLANDLLNGHPVKRDEVILTPLVASHPGLTMGADGRITVAPETPEGTYTYTYRICEVLNPTNCDEDLAEIIVIKASIDAIEDIYIDRPINGKDGGTTPSVLNNDKLNGVILNPADVILTPRRDLSPGLPASITMNPNTGVISVAPETRAGTYVYRYEICEVINPTNCDQADVTILVVAPKIDAIDDYPAEISGYTGGTTSISVLDNDLLNGVILNPADVTLYPLVSPSAGIVMNANGTVTVAAGVPVGTYPYPYRICEVLNPTNCDIATAFIKVVRAGIVANNDTPDSINGKVGGKTPSVLDNDLLNGNPVDPNEIKLIPGAPSHSGLVMNTDGTITVAPETPAGTYTYPYTICEILNPNNCDNAVATIKVDAAPIDAIDDDFTGQAIYGRRGATTVESVLENDLLNGRLVLPREVTLTPGARPHPNIQMNADGTITIAANTPEGTYNYPYEICEVLNPTNCDQAIAKIVVLKTEIFALDDIMDVQNTRTGAVSDESVLTNDQLNNLPLVNGEYTLSPGVPSDPGLTMNPDGTINVAPGMKPGTYTYPYTICEVLNPTNCDDAIATVRVMAPELVIPNTFTPNDDGKNQYFEIVGIEGYDYIELTVVNRWGNLVFKNDKYDNQWDGKGVNEGTYFYIIKTVLDGHSQVYKGYVTIKRY